MQRIASFTWILAGALCLGLGLAGSAAADGTQRRGGQVLLPDSSVEDTAAIGVKAHTHLRIFVPAGGMHGVMPPQTADLRRNLQPDELPPGAGYFFLETPASLACVYHLASHIVPGCNPYSTVSNPSGGARAIALVDAFDDPTAAVDLAIFSAQFGLRPANFQLVYAAGSEPAFNSGWAVEEALDVQWAHAMAPNAKIFLVEAASNSFSDLMTAVGVASGLVAGAGGGEVSMSWGGSEFASEAGQDTNFTTPGVVYVASAGDSPGVQYPAASPNVVAVGGTSLSRNPFTGNFQRELSWQQSGGGPSQVEPLPAYQASLAEITGGARGVPDVSAVADPTTGVWVYQGGTWFMVGGTSVAAPVWAGIINAAGKFSASSADELAAIYSSATGYNHITDGDCGPYEGYLAASPWSFCGGHGSPHGPGNK